MKLLLLAAFVLPVFAESTPTCGTSPWHTYICAGNQAYRSGDFKEAEAAYRAAIKDARERGMRMDLVVSLNRLALVYKRQGRYLDAQRIQWRVITLLEEKLSANDPRIGVELANVAITHTQRQEYSRAAPLFRRATRILEAAGPAWLPQLAQALDGEAAHRHLTGRSEEAAALYQLSLRARRLACATELSQASTLSNLASLEMEQGKLAEAEARLRQVIALREQAQGANHPDLAAPVFNLARLFARQGRHEEAAAGFQRVLEMERKQLGEGHPNVAITLANLAESQRALNHRDQAQASEENAKRILKRHNRDNMVGFTLDWNAAQRIAKLGEVR